MLQGLAVLAVAALALAAANGCGSGGSSGSSSSSASAASESSETTSGSGSPESPNEGPESPGGLPGESEGPSGKSSGGSSGSSGSPSGGSSGGGGQGSDSTAKVAFIKEANAVCTRTKRSFEKAIAEYLEEIKKNPPKPTEASPELKIVEVSFVPIFQRQVDGIEALRPPPGDSQTVAAILESLQQVVDGAKEDPERFIEEEASFGAAPKLAKAYGLRGCAET